MSTLNGVGTFRYGKDDVRADGSFVATTYFVVFFFPIIPLSTKRVKLHTVDERKAGVSEYEVVEDMSLRWRQIARTYARCWLLVPLVLLWPMIVLIAIGGITFAISGKDTSSRVMNQIVQPVAVVFSIYFIVMATYLLRRARRVGLPTS